MRPSAASSANNGSQAVGASRWRPRGWRFLVEIALAAALFLSFRDVYATNKAFTFVSGRIDPLSFTALDWLRGHDRGPYYVQLGSPHIWLGVLGLGLLVFVLFAINDNDGHDDLPHSP